MKNPLKNFANYINESKYFIFLFCIKILLSPTLLISQNEHNHHTHNGEKINLDSNNTVFKKHAEKIKLVTGQGDFIFSWDEKLSSAFPKEANKFEQNMHGGFNEDLETGTVYTGIPGYGLCSISPDLREWKTIGVDEKLKDNIHGIVHFSHKGKKLLALAQEGKRVLILTTEGKILSEIHKPLGNEFNFDLANKFFSSNESNFGVTDVTYLEGIIYVAHGYSEGDFILTIEEKNGVWSWGNLAWGGKGNLPGQFQTAHGIYAHENHIYVASRAAGEVIKFTKDGQFVNIFKDIPKGSLICNISHKSEHYFMNALQSIGNQKSAPIYVHTSKQLKSTIIPGELEIPGLTNIHQVWPHVVKNSNGKKQLYILVHGWNKGKYAVLKLVK